MLGVLLALAGGAYLASRGIVRIGAEPPRTVYLYDILFNLLEPFDPKNPEPGQYSWKLDESIGPKPVNLSVLNQLSFFDDWEWNLADSSSYRWATRYVFDPLVGQWQQVTTRQNY